MTGVGFQPFFSDLPNGLFPCQLPPEQTVGESAAVQPPSATGSEQTVGESGFNMSTRLRNFLTRFGLVRGEGERLLLQLRKVSPHSLAGRLEWDLVAQKYFQKLLGVLVAENPELLSHVNGHSELEVCVLRALQDESNYRADQPDPWRIFVQSVPGCISTFNRQKATISAM